jgi:S-DNA-T family DNA segregation ATPase FtsK/SpoIIIE
MTNVDDTDVFGRLTALVPGIVTAGLFGLVTGNMTFAAVSVVAAMVTIGVWRADVSRRRRRRRRETEQRDRTRADMVAEHVGSWTRFHEARADRLRYEHPCANELAIVAAAGDERLWHWRATRHDDAWRVALGRGSETMGVEGTGTTIVVDEMPRLVDLAPGSVIGVHGSSAMAVARSMVVRLAVRSGPADLRLTAWPRSVSRTIGLAGLPHFSECAPHVVCVVDEPGRWVEYSRSRGSECVVVVSSRREELPADCSVIIDADEAESMDAKSADDVVRALCPWIDPEVMKTIEQEPNGRDERSSVDTGSPFAVVLGEDDRGREARIDIVRDGPHAVVVGCTGSGKSELLLRWITEMTANVDVSMLNVLAVDYKGGSTSDVLERLPHTVGVLTDLDRRTVDRAVAAFRCEFRDREERLRTVGARSIDDCAHGSIPRLLVVVDEVAALRAQSPEFLQELLTIAHRGRSLGIHLILATQRPHALTADIVANSDIRVALRVLNAGDSMDVVGSPIAASFPRRTPGRAAVSCSGSEPIVVNARVANVGDVVGEKASPLWRSALPSRVDRTTHPDALAVLDDIERRDQPRLRDVDGWWLVVGEPLARRVAMDAIAAHVDADVLSSTDCDAELIHRTALALESRATNALVLDGVDDIVAHCMVDAASRLAWSRLERCLSSGGVATVIATCARESGTPLVIRDRCSRTFRMIDVHGGFETLVDGRNVFGRFVTPTTPSRLRAVERLRRSAQHDGAFAVYADDGRAVELSPLDPWRVLIIGEAGSGRTTAMRSLAEHWRRERGHLERRLVSVDHDEVPDDANIDGDDVDLIAVADPLELRNSFDHWAHVVRRQRTGLLLGRAASEHADLLGVAPPPRPYAIAPGRGEWVHHGNAMGIVQVTV